MFTLVFRDACLGVSCCLPCPWRLGSGSGSSSGSGSGSGSAFIFRISTGILFPASLPPGGIGVGGLGFVLSVAKSWMLRY